MGTDFVNYELGPDDDELNTPDGTQDGGTEDEEFEEDEDEPEDLELEDPDSSVDTSDDE